ncbi:nucleotidyltransferase family protein [Alphaproteobacteria bacterium KMM 3653]|uniref:Nucleotidyltransferase family protein n=1 Tax=Harenicola maris TaxID=2841044 RepID=A0AAP2CNZ3_9RHOB|nr:nucleotidyltransferase family protein [Harenicola maris]
MPLPLMIFGAGFGTRMGALTQNTPKPLIQTGGKALIDHAVALADTAKSAPVVVNTHYLAEQMQAHFAPRPEITLSHEPDILETGGGLRRALPLLHSNPVLTLNSDAIWRGPNPLTLLEQAWRPEMEALLLLLPAAQTHGRKPDAKGDFALTQTGQITRPGPLVYSGAQIIRTDRLAQIAEEKFSLNVIWNEMIAAGTAHGIPYPGEWCDVGHPGGIPIAESLLV